MVFDVEGIGLHGEGFAVGWVVVDGDGNELGSGIEACDPGEAIGHPGDAAWVAANIPPIARTRHTPFDVRGAFWRCWMAEKEQGAVLVADCAWPVEARFLAACVDDFRRVRAWDGPYPLHEVATMRLAAGLDPLATAPRLPTEEPKHDPLADARQSARLFIEAVNALRARS
jgi:hypothetical protein